MARLPRLVLPGIPHHVTQRGNRRAPVFFEEGDYALYKDLLFNAAAKARCEIWCYCLMPNHVHFVVVPSAEDGLRQMFANAHRRYTGYVNARLRVTGHLWQSRFGSVPMDETHLFNAFLYVSLNPVRARLVDRAEDWEWSSVRSHINAKDEGAFKAQPALDRVGNFNEFLTARFDEDEAFSGLRQQETIGRPLGDPSWIKELEDKTGRTLMAQKRGPKLKAQV